MTSKEQHPHADIIQRTADIATSIYALTDEVYGGKLVGFKKVIVDTIEEATHKWYQQEVERFNQLTLEILPPSESNSDEPYMMIGRAAVATLIRTDEYENGADRGFR